MSVEVAKGTLIVSGYPPTCILPQTLCIGLITPEIMQIRRVELSSHVIISYVSSALTDFLSKLFTALLEHGHVAEGLCNCILHPVPMQARERSF